MNDAALMTTEEGVTRVQAALAERDLDGWLLYEFRGQNWISAQLLGTGWTTRRSYVLVPRKGRPKALVHAIEHAAWRHWPWELDSYAGWREMEEKLHALLKGSGRVAVETSPGAAVPTVDLVPAGTIELLRSAGVEPVSSGDLVSLFFSAWTPEQLVDHRRTAETIAGIAQAGFEEAARAIREGSPHSEGSLTRWVLERMTSNGVPIDADTHIAIGPRAADPHYSPAGEGETISAGDVLLIDLWGRSSEAMVFADQTWMAVLAGSVDDRLRGIWNTVRDARDAGVALLTERASVGREVRGFEVDDACRAVISDAGFGEYFIHRTGHSMDRKLHGSGPNLDNLETRDDRILVPGIGFSVEPGIYIPNDVGMRTEINVHFSSDGPEVTPTVPQVDLFLFDV